MTSTPKAVSLADYDVRVPQSAMAQRIPKAADDAKTAAIFGEEKLPAPIVFDHARIIEDYWHYKGGGSPYGPSIRMSCWYQNEIAQIAGDAPAI